MAWGSFSLNAFMGIEINFEDDYVDEGEKNFHFHKNKIVPIMYII